METLLAWATTSGLHLLGVIIAFSFLIFIHELGHFLAALAVGVRVEKFMLGFDVWGLGLKAKVRGIEYGLGLLPLGGYVKLAGQSDMPGEETGTGAPDELMSKGPAARGLVYGAGVAMNLLAGFLLLVAAQLYGVQENPSIVGYVVPDGPAAQAGILAGDRIVSINNEAINTFDQITQKIALSEGKALRITVSRGEGAEAEKHEFDVVPIQSSGRGRLYKILVEPRLSRTVFDFHSNLDIPDGVRTRIATGDEILAVDGKNLDSNTEGGWINNYVSKRAGQEVELTVRPDGAQPGETRTVRMPIIPLGAYDIGRRFKVPVIEVDAGTPAAKAGLKKGDWIGEVEGERFETPYDLGRLIAERCFAETKVRLRRNGTEMTVSLLPRSFLGDSRVPTGTDNFLGVRLAERKDNGDFIVDTVFDDGPAAGKLQPGDTILSIGTHVLDTTQSLCAQVAAATLKPVSILRVHDNGEEETLSITPAYNAEHGRPLIGIKHNPGGARTYRIVEGSIAERLGLGLRDTGLEFSYSSDLSQTTLNWQRELETANLAPEPMTTTFDTPKYILDDPFAAGLEGYLPFRLQPHFVMVKAPTLAAAVTAAWPEAVRRTMAIYLFLEKLVTGGIHHTAIGGPVQIVEVMYVSSELGFGKFLSIVAFISLNLGVLNLLPIPVLDGGHILFLLVEAVLRRKPNPKIMEYAQYAGFVFLLGLMLMAMGMDVYYKWLGGGNG